MVWADGYSCARIWFWPCAPPFWIISKTWILNLEVFWPGIWILKVLSGKQPNAFLPDGDNSGQRGKMCLRRGLIACALLGSSPRAPCHSSRWDVGLVLAFLCHSSRLCLETLKAGKISYHVSSHRMQKTQPLRVEEVLCFRVLGRGCVEKEVGALSWSDGHPASLTCPLPAGASRVLARWPTVRH